MSIWFDDSGDIACSLQHVKDSVADHGAHHVGVVERMPGLTQVELLEAGSDSVTIRTNEGLMTRTGITTQVESDRVAVEFDEVYEAGTKMTATSHYRHEFTVSDVGVEHHVVISGVEAPGILGFFYRKLGRANIGKATLEAYRSHLEQSAA